MFVAPWQMGGPWSARGLSGIERFVNRVWSLVAEPAANTGLVESARVNWSFGHGYRQAAGSSGSHANAAPAGTTRNAATTAAMSTPARTAAKCYQRATGGAPVDELRH